MSGPFGGRSRRSGAAHGGIARAFPVRRSPILPLAALATAVSVGACLPRAVPLEGAPAPARFPATELPRLPQQVAFQWEYEDPDFRTRGDGVARIAPPDSVRLDLFVAGGFGSAMAWVIGDTVVAPGGYFVRRLLPPPPLMWAALGRLAVPAAADTVARRLNDTLRADIGRGDVWRVTFADDRLVRLERIEGGRLLEWVAREPDGLQVQYRHETARRSLVLAIIRTDTVPAFDATIWPR